MGGEQVDVRHVAEDLRHQFEIGRVVLDVEDEMAFGRDRPGRCAVRGGRIFRGRVGGSLGLLQRQLDPEATADTDLALHVH